MSHGPAPADNTPWWLPDVTTSGAGAGVLVRRCNPFGAETGGPKHLEGGFYPSAQVGEHAWECHARADLRCRMTCRCGHKGQLMDLCNGHVMMIRKRMSGVCPRCAHPPAELEIQLGMQRVRVDAAIAVRQARDARGAAEIQQAAAGRLWGLQAALDKLVERGTVHRCPLTLTEVS
jgi:hypothetical protein